MARLITDAIIQGIDAALQKPSPNMVRGRRATKRGVKRCADHAPIAETLARLDSRTRITLWLALALLLHSLGAGPVEKLIGQIFPIAESVASESAPK